MNGFSGRLNLWSIIVAAVVTILFEFTLTRILSFIFWNHLVYLTVTVALLGFGISGTLVAVFGRDRPLADPRFQGHLWFGLGLSMLITLPVASSGLAVLAMAPPWLKLGTLYIFYVVPFVFSGAILSSLFAAVTTHSVGRLYAADLLASGAACVAFYFLLPSLGAQALVLLLGCGAFAMSYVWLRQASSPSARTSAVVAAVSLVFCIGAVANPRFLDFSPEAYKELGHAKRVNPAIVIDATTWTPISRIDVVGTTDNTSPLRGYPHPPGSFKMITQDATAHTRLLSKEAIDDLNRRVAEGAELHGSNLVYQVRKQPDVAVIGVGGGVDVASALAYGARSVVGIELNPATADYVKSEYADYNGGLLSDRRVQFHNWEGRSFLRTTDRQFDVVQVIAIDTFAALNSGAYVLSENYLYTVDAFREFRRKLAPDGILSFYRFLMSPPRETLRLAMVAAEAWRAEGVADVRGHFMILGSDRENWGLSLYKRDPFTEAEVEQLSAAGRMRGMPVLYWPRIHDGAAQSAMIARNDMPLTPAKAEARRYFTEAIEAAAAGKSESFFASYPYAVFPTTDDDPFFFEYHKLGAFGFPSIENLRGDGVSTTLLVILIESVVLSLFAIFLPLVRYQRAGLAVTGVARFSFYFAAIGFGFMLVEIALIQKAVLLLGNPMYALSVVLATVLLGAGTGSYVQARLRCSMASIVNYASLALIGVLAVLSVALTPLFQSLLALPTFGRFGVVVVLLFPIGVVMGMFMPTGLQALRDERAAFVPWAWGINGCTSVFGSVAAILLALSHGFSTVLIAGALCYGVAWYAGVSALRSSEAHLRELSMGRGAE